MLASFPSRVLAGASSLLLCAIGCASVKTQTSNDGGGVDTAAPSTDAPMTADAPADLSLPVDHVSFDFSGAERPPPAPGKVYAHSDTTLWLLEPISKQVTMVGLFDCVGTTVKSMVDIAIDRAGKMTGSAAISFNNALGGALVVDRSDQRALHRPDPAAPTW